MNREELDEILDLKKDIKTYDEYISTLQKKCDKWKACWESAEKGKGILMQNLKSLRELQELEIGEIMEREKKILEILNEIPPAPSKYQTTELLSEWIDSYIDWYKRMTEHLSDD